MNVARVHETKNRAPCKIIIHTKSYTWLCSAYEHCNGVNGDHLKQFSLILLIAALHTKALSATRQTKRAETKVMFHVIPVEMCSRMQLPNGNNGKLSQIAAVAARKDTRRI